MLEICVHCDPIIPLLGIKQTEKWEGDGGSVMGVYVDIYSSAILESWILKQPNAPSRMGK